MARKKVEKQIEPKPKKETVTRPQTKKAIVNHTNREEYENGKPCKHEDCSNTLRRLPCRYCGRTKQRGITIIEDRTGNVYLERLREIDIKFHNELPVHEQETATLHIFRSPKYLDK
jgi:hypothetical protein